MRRTHQKTFLVLAMFLSTPLTSRAQTFNPATIGFGNWVVQTTSTAKATVLTNTLTVPLTISSISTSGDFSETSTCPISPNTLAAGAKCQILVTFTPTAIGVRTGLLTVNDDSGTSPQTAQLSGNGVPPVVLLPASVTFANQLLNTTSAAKTFTIANNQTAALTITSISTSGDFAATSTCPLSPNTLAANSSCTASITFTPTATGKRSGTLTITDNAQTSPQTAALAGTGVVAVTLNPTSFSFSGQTVNTTSVAKTLSVQNNQSNPLTISSISASGDFAQTSTCPFAPNTLAAGAICTVSITFTPTALGTRSGTLTVTDDANNSPQTASLSGTGSLGGLTTISISPSNPTVFTGHQQQLTATGTFLNGQSVNITNFVTWSSSAPTSVQVSSAGLVQAVAAGSATVTAAYKTVSGWTSVTAQVPVLTSIALTPANPSVPLGAYQQFSAALNYSDGSTKNLNTDVAWSSSSTAVAAVGSSGFASTLSTGTTTIQASSGSITGSTTLSVSQPSCTTAPAGLVGWWTGDGNTVDIAGNNSGTLQSGATYGTGEVAQGLSLGGNGASLLVNSTVYPPSAGTLMFWFFPTGAAGALTGSYVGPQNRGPGFSIDSSGNLNWEFANLYAQSLGQVGLNQWNHVALTYSTSNAQTTVNVYLNGTLVANAITDANTSWNSQVAFGAYLGAQQPSFTGSIDEIAIFNQALTSSQILQVYNAFSAGMCKPQLQSIAVSPASPNLAPGLSLQFGAAGMYSDSSTHDLTTSATWSTSNSTIATVSASGMGTAVASGSTTVSAALGSLNGSSSLNVAQSLTSIRVTPQNPSCAGGTVRSFTATGTFANGSQQDLTKSVTWTTSAPNVATIASNGTISCVAAGQTTVTATAGSVSGNSLLTVTSATLSSISVTPSSPSIVAGATQPFTATGTFSNGTQQNLTTSVTWSSSAPSVATIASSGVASSIASGQSTITATLGTVSGTASLTVTTATLAAIQITPQSPIATIGSGQQFSATGIYSDGSSGDVTASATWSSSASTVATMSTSSQGQAVSTGTGATRISASYGALAASTTLTVQDQVVSLAITPPAVSIATGNGNSQPFTATGTYASGLIENVTSISNWSSSAPNVASVSSSGIATGLASGQATIEASMGNVTASANVIVVPPDPLGTVAASSITCPSTGAPGGTCYALAISCPNIADLTGYVKVRYTGTGAPVGTVLFSMGGTGVALYESYTFGPTVLNAVLQAGYTVADTSWDGPFTNQQPEGWLGGPGGTRALACRWATLAQWIYTNIHLANSSAPYCATGASAAAQAVGLGLAHYGLGSIFAMVDVTSGPVYDRQDWACDCAQPNATNPCGVRASYCVGLVDAQTFIDPSYAGSLCSDEVNSHSTVNDPIFYHDSVNAPDSALAYPKTFVRFLYGGLDTEAPNQGHVWASSITSSQSEACVPNVGHSLPSTQAGAQQIAADLLNYCKLPAGQQ